MSALMVRNLPDDVHATLRRVAAERHVSLESLVRQLLSDVARANQAAGIDFDQLGETRACMGFAEDGPAWDDALDDPALSRKVLGLS